MALRHVEQGPGRHSVRDAHGIEADCRHVRKVPLDHLEAVILVSVLVGPERAIRDATHIELFVSDKQELAPNPRSQVRCRMLVLIAEVEEFAPHVRPDIFRGNVRGGRVPRYHYESSSLSTRHGAFGYAVAGFAVHMHPEMLAPIRELRT